MPVLPLCGNPTCKQNVKKADKALRCEICESWFHFECIQIEDEVYELLKKKVPGVHWFCDFCNLGCAKVMKIMGKLKDEIDVCREELKEMKKLKAQVVENRFNIDKMEQYSRKDNVRISNLPDPHDSDEDTNQLVVKLAKDLGVEITERDISTSHRLGKNSVTYCRPVIVKFCRRDTKMKIMMKRKLLKDHADYDRVYVNDDLTKVRYKLCKQLREDSYKAWTIGGKIFFKDAAEVISTIDSFSDVCKLNWSEEKLTELGILQ